MIGHENVAAQQESSPVADVIEDSGENPKLVFRKGRAGPENVAGDEEDLAGYKQSPQTGHATHCSARFVSQILRLFPRNALKSRKSKKRDLRYKGWKGRNFTQRKLRYKPMKLGGMIQPVLTLDLSD
jgi:hypothetical protein